MPEESIITPEMRQLVATWQAGPLVFEVEKGAINRYAQAIGDANPLWTDEARAQQSKHGGLVAVPVFLMNFNPFHNGVAFPMRPLRGSASAGEVFEFYDFMRPGDTITVTERLKDIYEKPGKRGAMIFTVDERTFTNQRGELVAKTNWTRVFYNVPSESKRVLPDVSAALASRLELLQQGAAHVPFQMEATGPQANQINFEDLDEGMELPSFVRHLTHELFVRFFAVSGDYAAHHVDYLYAVAEGWRDCIAQGLLGTAYLCKLVTDWIGEEGMLRKLRASYRGPGYPGDTWTCKGKVSRKYRVDGQNWVDCEICVENQDGLVVTPGSATVALHSKG